MRVTPASLGRNFTPTGNAAGFRNEIVSLQFALRSSKALDSLSTESRQFEPSAVPNSKALSCSWVETRYPGYWLVDEVGGYTSDPLYEEAPERLEANASQAVWLTIHIPKTAASGPYEGSLYIRAGPEQTAFTIRLMGLDATLPDPSELIGFVVNKEVRCT